MYIVLEKKLKSYLYKGYYILNYQGRQKLNLIMEGGGSSIRFFGDGKVDQNLIRGGGGPFDRNSVMWVKGF